MGIGDWGLGIGDWGLRLPVQRKGAAGIDAGRADDNGFPFLRSPQQASSVFPSFRRPANPF